MPRIIIHTRKAPIPVKDSKGRTVAALCMCGLSKKYPFCDGSHIRARDEQEDKIYIYDEEGNRVGEIELEKLQEILKIKRIRKV